MAFFAIYVTYRMMGKDYDAIVLSAGHCGFGLGATPTAVANMQAIYQSFRTISQSVLNRTNGRGILYRLIKCRYLKNVLKRC